MTQFAPPIIPELPDEYNGDNLADDLTSFRAAYESGQIGTTRPAWAEAGFPWVKDNGDGTMSLMIWDGSTDRAVALVKAGATAAEWRTALSVYSQAEADAAFAPKIPNAGDVGSPGMFDCILATNLSIGQNVAGSNLRWASTSSTGDDVSGVSPSGTWRWMSTGNEIGIAVRIAL